jgi:D-lactate dehydrogenase
VKIAVFEVEDWERDAFQTLSDRHEIAFSHEPLDSPEEAQRHADAQVLSPFIYSDLDADMLRRFPALELVVTRSTGFDHIDTEYCRDNGIMVCNVPTYGDNTVAEHVFGLLLAISHRLPEAVDRTRRGDFSQQGLRGFDLRGKTLGVVGTGAIGRYVIEIARGFRMRVLAYDVRQDEELEITLGFRYCSLDEVLARSDIITLHVPYNEHTHHLLDDAAFQKMKQGVVIINTARGGLIDIRALVRGLADGKVSAAGLDVLPEEPTIREEAELLHSIFREEHDLAALLADHILLRLRNVIITPHSAFNTQEAIERILHTTVENIVAYEQGKPQNVVAGTIAQ